MKRRPACEPGRLKFFRTCADKGDMKALRSIKRAPGKDERGFTMPELLVTILIMSLIFAIGIPSYWSVIEGRNVDSATNKFVADLRLTHSKATNQLTTWRVVLNPGRGAESAGADYSLVPLNSSGNPVTASAISRTLPDNAKLDSPTLSVPLVGTRAVQFAPDGSASAVGILNLGVAGTDGCPSSTPATGPRIRITVDNDPMHCVTFNTATSRVRVD